MLSDPFDENGRLRALQNLGVLDTKSEDLFDRFTQTASLVFSVPIAVVSLVDADRQWFKSCVGLDVDGTSRGVAFCDHAIRSDDVFVIPDAERDPRFSGNPLVTGEPRIRFYAGAPLVTPDGFRIGTLCIIDRAPRDNFSSADAAILKSLAGGVMAALLVRSEARASHDLAQIASDRRRLLSLAEDMAQVGTWSWDAVSNVTYWSPQVYAIHGLDPSQPPPALGGVLSLYSPDDAAVLGGLVERALTEGRDYQLEAAIIRPDGECRNVIAHGTTRQNDDGAVIALMGTFQDITHLRVADQRTRQSEARFRLLAESTTDLVLMLETSGVISYASPGASILGYNPAELVGRRRLELIHPDDHWLAKEIVRRLAADEPLDDVPRRDYRFLCKGGGYVWMEGNPRIIRNDAGTMTAVVSVFRDMTARRRLEDALVTANAEAEAAANRYRRLADNTNDIVSESDLAGRFTYLSAAVTTVSGYAVEEALGRPALDFVHPDDRERVQAEITAALAAGDGRRVEYRHIRKDGEVIWVEARPTLAFDPLSEKPVAVRDVIRDITLRKAYEAALEAARDAAVASTKAKSEFLSNMSHEIRTPLNSIIGFAGLLERMPDIPPAARTYCQRIVTGGDALLLVVNDILDLARIESGQIELETLAFDPSALISETVDLIDPQAKAKGLRVTLASDPSTPDAVLGDPARLRQILLNFLSNAIKFTDAGTVAISVEYGGDQSETLRVAVADTGVGVPADRIGALFQRFEQVDNSISRRFGGTGLGLAISKQLAELMGGEVGVASEVGVGSTFWFAVPTPRAVLPEIREETVQLANAVDTIRLLVVDDLPVNRELIRTILAPFDVSVHEADNGLQAVQIAERQPFDLILMDIQMPRMDGLEATRAIRLGRGPNMFTPIVALTADTLPAHLEASRLAGMNDHISKPFVVAVLIDRIAQWVGPSDERQPDWTRTA